MIAAPPPLPAAILPAAALFAGAIPPPAPTEIGLVDATGRPFTLAELRGRFVWLYLGYASCPDACPRTLDVMVSAYDRLPDKKQVVPVFLSVDPMRDTPERLKAYTGFYHPDLLGASGPHAAIDALVAALGTRYEIPKGKTAKDVYPVAHPDEVFVLDRRGRYVGRLPAAKGDLLQALGVDLAARLAAPEAETVAPPPPSTADAWCGLPTEEVLADPDPSKDPRMHRAATIGSGTSVLPATTPMRMWSRKEAGWLWMAHLNAVAGAAQLGGSRGTVTRVAENWQMLMGSRYVGPGLFDVKLMTSLEPLTVPGSGTPQLFQGGETWQGRPLLDSQHPHELLGELSARYTWTPDPRLSVFAYGGLAGDPALGPSSYLHRPSAADNHWAPLGHHQQDSTHVSYGVATAGVRLGTLQLEGSVFNGREPDEDRMDLDLGPLDSWSTRLSWYPGRHWVAQVSHGRLHREGDGHHGGDEGRTSASFTGVTNTPLGRWSTSLVWGQTGGSLAGTWLMRDVLQSYGLESQLDWAGRHHLYGRYELLDRPDLPGSAAHATVRVNALTLGYAHDLGPIDRWALALGADATAYSLEAATRGAYGDNPLMGRVYLRLRPPTTTHPEDRDPIADGPTR